MTALNVAIIDTGFCQKSLRWKKSLRTVRRKCKIRQQCQLPYTLAYYAKKITARVGAGFRQKVEKIYKNRYNKIVEY